MAFATNSEALAEYARNAGQDNADMAYILTPWDTWEVNPFYRGLPVPHPEDDVLYEMMNERGITYDMALDCWRTWQRQINVAPPKIISEDEIPF